MNALRILAKRQNKAYEKEQNRFEDIQKRKIIDKINSKYLVAKNITREQQIRPGMDAIVYDKEKKHLQVIELKYKLPIESTSDLINLDAMLNKAYNQIKIAEEMVEGNKTFILEEYFGESFKGIIPDFVDYFVITNYSVGTGRNCILPSPIILESHYLSMMKLNNGMYNVHYAFCHREYNEKEKLAKERFHVHERLWCKERYWEDPDYPFDWTEGEFC